MSENFLPAGFVDFVLADNPLSNSDRLVLRLAEGATIQEYVERVVPDELHDHLSVFINGHYLERDGWHCVKPKSGASVLLKVVPADPLSLVAVAAPLFGSLGATALAGAGFIAAAGSLSFALAAGAISFGVLALGSALFSPSRTDRIQQEESPSFSIAGARNDLRRYQPVPVVLGRVKVVPPYGGNPYTEIRGGSQFLRLLLVWGYGPLQVNSVKIGNTNLSKFDGVVQNDDFDGTDKRIKGYPSRATQENLAIRLTQSFEQRTTDIETTEIGFTVTFPGGLYASGEGGNRVATFVQIRAEYRLTGSGNNWTEFYVQVASDNSARVKFVSGSVEDLPLGQYDVRIRRDNPELALTDPRVQDRCDWTALRSFDDTGQVIEMDGVAKTSLRIKASDQLNGVVDQVNAIATSIAPVWNGLDWNSTEATRNPAALFRYVLTGPANKTPVDASQIDDEKLGEWYEFCESMGLRFDQYVDFRISLRDLLQDIANAGMASPNFIDDKWGVIIEKERTFVVQHFTARNTSNISSTIAFREVPEGLKIRFFNADAGYQDDERIVYDDGFSDANATRFEVIDLPGQTDPDNVYKLGRRYLAALRLRPETWTFECDIEHLVATRGDLCRLSHDVIRVGQTAGRITAIDGNTLTLDEPVTMLAGQSYGMRVRQSDGVSNYQAAITVAGTSTTIEVADATNMAVGDLFMFGEAEEETIEVLIRDIEYLDNLAARITAVPYSPAVYNSTGVIPDYTTVISDPVSASFNGPPAPIISEVITDEEALRKTAKGDLQPGILLYVQAGAPSAVGQGSQTRTVALQARYRRTGTDDSFIYTPVQPIEANIVRLDDVDRGETYDVEVFAVGPLGEVSVAAQTSGVVVIGAGTIPDAVESFGINTIGDHSYVEWDYFAAPIDLAGFEIRYHPDPDITTWSSMSDLALSVSPSARSATVPSRSGSYAIKPYDILGQRSADALYVNASLEDPEALNSVLTISEAPTFVGTKTNVEVVANELLLTAIDATTFEADGTYEFGETDLGAVYTSRVSAILDLGIESNLDFLADWETLSGVANLVGGATGDESRVWLEVAASLVDSASPSYGPWQRFVVGDYTGRHLKFRLRITSSVPEITRTVTLLDVSIDMPDRIETAQDVVSGAATASVSFSPAFRQLRSVSVNAQNLQSGDYYEITNKARSGFDVTFRDSGGTAVSRTFDWQAIGFGQERGT